MNQTRETWIRTAGAIVLLIAAALLIWRVRDVVVIVLLSLVCAYVLRPLVQGLGRRLRLPRGLIAAVVFVLFGLMLWGIWELTAPCITRQIDQVQTRLPDYRAGISRLASQAGQYYRERLPTPLRRSVDSWIAGLPDLLTSAAVKGLGVTVHGVGAAIELLLVPILVFYFLADGPGIRRQALSFVPRGYLHRTETALDQADDILQRYIKGQVILCLIAFVVVTLGLWALNVDFYLLLGFIAGLTRAVPIIGPLVGAIPILIVVLVTKSSGLAVWILILFSLMHLLESKLLMPLVLGQQLDLHPVLIIVALLIGAQMGGLLGVFLATPVLAAARALLAHRRTGPDHSQ